MDIFERKQQWANRIRDDLPTVDRDYWYSDQKYFDDTLLGNFEAVYDAKTSQSWNKKTGVIVAAPSPSGVWCRGRWLAWCLSLSRSCGGVKWKH